MPQVGFELTIPVFELAKIFRAFDRVATDLQDFFIQVISLKNIVSKYPHRGTIKLHGTSILCSFNVTQIL
jgi:hypothetical protein